MSGEYRDDPRADRVVCLYVNGDFKGLCEGTDLEDHVEQEHHGGYVS